MRRDASSKGATVGRIKEAYIGTICKYPLVGLWVENRQKLCSVHRLVCEAFHGPPPTNKEVNHKNGIKFDNDESNLEWVTKSENIQHALAMGLHRAPRGASHVRAKLTEDDVRAIRLRVAEGHTHRAVAGVFKISHWQVGRICYRTSWAWLK